MTSQFLISLIWWTCSVSGEYYLYTISGPDRFECEAKVNYQCSNEDYSCGEAICRQTIKWEKR